jgi:hypothetical protein
VIVAIQLTRWRLVAVKCRGSLKSTTHKHKPSNGHLFSKKLVLKTISNRRSNRKEQGGKWRKINCP